jgi:DNA-binding LacI/PurR family transcriptional regulator
MQTKIDKTSLYIKKVLLESPSVGLSEPITIAGVARTLNLNERTVRKALKPFISQNILKVIKRKGIVRVNQVENSKKSLAMILFSDGHYYGELTNEITLLLHEKKIIPRIINLSGFQDETALQDCIENLIFKEGVNSFIFDGGAEIVNSVSNLLKNVQTVFINTYGGVDEIPGSAVLIDFEEGIRTATRHFIKRGFKNIVLVCNEYRDKQISDPLSRERHVFFQAHRGYYQAMENAGLKTMENTFLWRKVDRSNRDKEFMNFFQKKKARGPIAFVCINDFAAVELMKKVVDLGFEITKDACFSGFYGTPWCEYAPVPLTSLYVDTHQLAAATVNCICQPSETKSLIKISPTLIIRESSGDIL